MVVSQDTRAYIVTHFEDFTAKGWAEKSKIARGGGRGTKKGGGKGAGGGPGGGGGRLSTNLTARD
jgi:uncharacterized membrane protein